MIRDGACLIALIALVQYNIKEQYIKHASAKTIIKYIARESFNKFTDAVSDTCTKVSEVTRRTKRDLEKKFSKSSQASLSIKVNQ